VVEASHQFTIRLNDLLRDAGVPTGYPLVIWRDREGFLKACACADRRSWVFVRDDVGAPDDLSTPTPPDPVDLAPGAPRTEPARPTTPQAPPQPSQQEDTTFF
jgi:hypothetical protein